MTRVATEESLGVVHVRKQRLPARVRFFALDGSVRVVVEADSEDDARYLCQEMGWEFIGLYEG